MHVDDFYQKMLMYGFTIDQDRFEEITNIAFQTRPVEQKIKKPTRFAETHELAHIKNFQSQKRGLISFDKAHSASNKQNFRKSMINFSI